MKVDLEPEALETLSEVAEYIDRINTPGAGEFWITDFILNLYTYAKPNVAYALCQNKVFAEEGLSCITYKGWVVAFKLEDYKMKVYQIVKGDTLL